MNWIIEHYMDLIAAVTAVVTASSAIAALTPSAKDDSVVALLRKLVDFLALNIGHAKK